MANYVGYFKGQLWRDGVNAAPSEVLYTVKLITDSGDTGFTEIALAGESPFVVRRETSETPFEPVQKSTATITIVHNEYLDDILSPYAHGTRVVVTRESGDTEEYVWEGFLTPKIYNQGYDDCFETIQLEAADCLASLQYFNYEIDDAFNHIPNPLPRVVRFSDILSQIARKCEIIDRYYWGVTKYTPSGIMIGSHQLSISERNFFSNDTEDPWTLLEVLEEICRYLGFNVFYQPVGNVRALWFIDNWSVARDGNANAYYYEPNYLDDNFVFAGMTSFTYNRGNATKNYFAGSGADISFEPIYNKAIVKDDYYFAEEWLPEIFDDNYLINKIDPCDRYAENELNITYGKRSGEDVADSAFTYTQRYYYHKFWKSTYRGDDDSIVTLPPEAQAGAVPLLFRGATIVDMATVGQASGATSPSSDQPSPGQWPYGWKIEPSKPDYTRYLCIGELSGIDYFKRNQYQTNISGSTLFTITDFPSQIVPSQNAYIVINFTAIYEKYPAAYYINPKWKQTEPASSNYLYIHGAFPIIIKIGDNYWDGKEAEWTSEPKYFVIRYNQGYNPAEKDWDNQNPKPNKEYSIINNVPWTFGSDKAGYIIPLSGVNMTNNVTISICTPTRQWGTGSSQESLTWGFNAYCWLKDISIKIIEPMTDPESSDNDVIYENVIDVDAVSQFPDVSFKLTTMAENTQPAYSNVAILPSGFDIWQPLEGIRESGFSNAQTPEANLVEKIVTQYSSSTKKINVTFKDNTKINYLGTMDSLDVENPDDKYLMLGGEYDYNRGSIAATYIQIK